MMDFNGKVVITTGAAGGIGRASAIQFAELGAKVAIADIDENGLAETAAADHLRGLSTARGSH